MKTQQAKLIQHRPDCRNTRRGISSLYLMITIMLSIMIVPSWVLISHCHTDAVLSQHDTYKTEINSAVEHWVKEKGRWPLRDLSDIGSDKNYFPDGIPINPISGQPYQLDRVTHLAR